MKLDEFAIGMEFRMSGRRRRCTDVGSRVVIAIMIDDREDQSWFNGPPYAVLETVIDENDLPACEPLAGPAHPRRGATR